MHLIEDDLVLHYYGEMSPAQESRALAHLAACGECQRAYRALQQVMSAVDQAGAAAFEPADGFERTVWARLQPALPPGPRGWWGWLMFSPARLVWLGVVVVLVTGAYVAGRLAPRGPAGQAADGLAASGGREAILLVDLSDHFERTQMVLVELVSADQDGGGPVNIAAERDRARELVASGRLYRQTAAGAGDARLVDLLDQLERVLVDVAASPAEVSAQDLDAVRRRIDGAGLLFKVRVVSTDLRDRWTQALHRAAPPTL